MYISQVLNGSWKLSFCRFEKTLVVIFMIQQIKCYTISATGILLNAQHKYLCTWSAVFFSLHVSILSAHLQG